MNGTGLGFNIHLIITVLVISHWSLSRYLAGLLVRGQQGEAGVQRARGGQVVGGGRGPRVHGQGSGSGHQPEDGQWQGIGQQGDDSRTVSADPVRTERGQ